MLLERSRFSHSGAGGQAHAVWSRQHSRPTLHPGAISKPKIGRMNLVFLLNITTEKKETTGIEWKEESARGRVLLVPSMGGEEEPQALL